MSIFASWSNSLLSRYIRNTDAMNTLPIDKGLTNTPGQNNCFLNATIQVLWHLDVFRRSFRRLECHACPGKSCIFCALKVIFTQYQHGEEPALPPEALRTALATFFEGERRFQLNVMDDAAECFENILNCVHYHLTCIDDEESCSAPHCVTHAKFAMNVLDEYKCYCGSSQEPRVYTQLVHYISATSLVSHSSHQTQSSVGSTIPFGKLLHHVGAVGDFCCCSNEGCYLELQLSKALLNKPDIISIGLIWDCDNADVQSIKAVMNVIGETLDPRDMFNITPEFTKTTKAYNLVGIVAYYGMHYSSFCFHTRQKLWVYLDDSRVRKVGPKWSSVVNDCCKAHYQPLLLVYASSSRDPVPMHTAMTRTVPIPFSVFRSKSSEPLDSSSSAKYSLDHQELKPEDEVAKVADATTTASLQVHQSTDSQDDNQLSVESSGDLKNIYSDAEKFVAEAQHFETQGNLDAALDCYSLATDQYDKAIMMSPAHDPSRFDQKIIRDRCFQRSRSLSLKLGVQRQSSQESPSRTLSKLHIDVSASTASVSQHVLPVVKEGVLIDLTDDDSTSNSTGSSQTLLPQTVDLWKQLCQEADELMKDAKSLEITADLEKALDCWAKAFTTYKKVLMLLPYDDLVRAEVQQKQSLCRNQARIIHNSIQRRKEVSSNLKLQTRDVSPAHLDRAERLAQTSPEMRWNPSSSVREQCTKCHEMVPWLRHGLCSLCRFKHKGQKTVLASSAPTVG